MIITKNYNTAPQNTVQFPYYMGEQPDKFASEKDKQSPKYIKNTLDYYSTIAYGQYGNRAHKISRNYNLLNGIIDRKDFFDEDEESTGFIDYDNYMKETENLLDLVKKDEELPAYVKHYPIINSPVNVMMGELSNRPDVHRVRAFDDMSKSEEFEYKTELVQQFIMQEATKRIITKLQMQGVDLGQIDEDQLNKLTSESVESEITDYTSLAEIWGNQTLDSLKAELNIKDKSEESFKDLLVANEDYFFIHRDNSNRKFNVRSLNPKNFWGLSMPDKKYVHEWHTQGIIEAMEISQIIDEFNWLTKDEIDHLRNTVNSNGIFSNGQSNMVSGDTGTNSIKYTTYSPLLEQERLRIESQLKSDSSNPDALKYYNLGQFGYKFVVVRVYDRMFKKIGKLTYIDEDGYQQTVLVDESYKQGSPNEVDIEWGYVEQIFEGVKIGTDVYHFEPYDLFEGMPIIGVLHNIKNSKSVSLVDLMKPLQTLFNIYMNKLYELIQKDYGIVYQMSLRHIPGSKDGDAQDALDEWEQMARDKGIIFLDDSPENLQAPSSFNQFSAVNLSRAQEMQQYYNLAAEIRNDCYLLVGMNPQRLGGASASETATGLQANLTQSFAQTEPYFQQHEYVLDMLYQRILDAAQTIESSQEVSTLSSISSLGPNSFIRVTPSDIRLRDLHVMAVSRTQDNQLFQDLRNLSQAALQNGQADFYDISLMYSTNSMRLIQKELKKFKDYKQQMEQQQQQIQQQQIESQQQIAQQQIQYQQQKDQAEMQNKNYNEAQDRASKERIALIQANATGNVQTSDNNNNGMPDVLESKRVLQDSIQKDRDYAIKQGQLFAQQQSTQAKLSIEKEKLAVARQNQENDLQIAKLQIQNSKVKKGL